ncbi:MAG: hypothetical protein JSS45_01350 [Proteobacteria bacterium]|nr:hypothetical protein [Pseudomonadota bacterium]MBS0598892.1 hypothetical protein [Pseudomonadota bacterium]
MIKWRECTEGDILFEAFLPEHDHDHEMQWLLRASRSGHVLAERSGSLTWRPTFGPDGGDVAAIDAEIDQLLPEVAAMPVSAEPGPYQPGPAQIAEPNPIEHAVLFNLLEQGQGAVAALGVPSDLLTQFLDLSEGCCLEDLYPIALSGRRAQRLQRLVALHHLVIKHPGLLASKNAILMALQVDDLDAIRRVLEDAGVTVAPQA